MASLEAEGQPIDIILVCDLLRRRQELTTIGGEAYVASLIDNEILDDFVTNYKRGGKRGIPREVGSAMASKLKPVREFFGDRKAMSVTDDNVEEFKTNLKSEGKQNSTVNRSLELLGTAYRRAFKTAKLSKVINIEKYDESGNARKGKFTPQEAEAVAQNVPDYFADVCRFGYQTGCRAGEILELVWSFLDGDAICVPGSLTKNRQPHTIALTPEIEEILDRRKTAMVADCPYIFHHNGQPIRHYYQGWAAACVSLGLGHFYCRDCRDRDGKRNTVLDAKKTCPACGKRFKHPVYRGRIFHDFRRSAAHEMWKAGTSPEDCMKVTGHKSQSMFKRYADLFSEEEQRQRQREVQQRRSEWRKAQANVVVTAKPTAVQ